MAKRKGKTFLSLPSSSGVKRLRENGRLKKLESSSNDEDQLLKDAGLDDEAMKSVPESERQAIMRAILESNQAKEIVMVESSESNDSKELVVNEVNEVETLPPDRFDDDCSRDSLDSPQSDLDIPPDGHHRTPASVSDMCIGSSQICEMSDNSQRSREDEAEMEEDANLDQMQTEATQPYQLLEAGDSPSVLAADTQFSPQNRCKVSQDVCDVIPESPVPTSPEIEITEEGGEEKEVENEASGETNCDLLKRVYPKRSTSVTFQDFLPRLSPGSIKDAALYSHVIKSMFEIYIRRLRLANNDIQEVPVKWGDPVKSGLHYENLLRRRSLISDKSENKDGKTGGRGRKRIFKRNPRKDVNSVDLINNENEDDRPNKPGEIENDIALDIPIDKCDTLASENIDVDDELTDTASNNQTTGKNADNSSVVEKSKSKLNSRSMANSANVPAMFNVTDVPVDNNTSDLLRCHLHRNSPSPCSSHGNNKAIPSPDIEILDDSSSELENNFNSWLRARNFKDSKTTSGRMQMRKAKTKSDAPRGTTKLLNVLSSKGKRESVGQRTISNISSKSDLCQVIEEEGGKKGDEELGFHTGVKKDANSKKEIEKSQESYLNDDIPSSVDSAYMLNSQGDMYSTQMTKIKLAKKSRLEKNDNAEIPIEVSAEDDRVIIASGSRSKLRKYKSTIVEEIEVFEGCFKRNEPAKGVIVDDQSRSPSTSVSNVPRSCTRKRKSGAVEEVETLEEHDSQLETTDGKSVRKSGKKRLMSRDNMMESHPQVDMEKWTSPTRSRKAMKSFFSPDKGECNLGERKQNTRKKKRLFDPDTYKLSNEIETKSCNVVGDTCKLDKIKKGIVERKGECFVLIKDNLQTQALNDERPSTSSNAEEIIANKGMCPICDKMFELEKLEAHAATCGEGTTDNEDPSNTECMICHEEIPSIMIKEHQSKCAASRGQATEEKATPARITRAKKSSNRIPKKNALLREMSPSSSGEDYGELIIDTNKGRNLV